MKQINKSQRERYSASSARSQTCANRDKITRNDFLGKYQHRLHGMKLLG